MSEGSEDWPEQLTSGCLLLKRGLQGLKCRNNLKTLINFDGEST
jgi:hypothetical protein